MSFYSKQMGVSSRLKITFQNIKITYQLELGIYIMENQKQRIHA
jgi:hypothetical protein